MRALAVALSPIFACALAAAAGCVVPAARPAAIGNRCDARPTFAAGGERSTLWIRTSAEYRTTSSTIYRAAQASLARALVDPAWSAEPDQAGDLSALPPAVVMDIDETVLDNSAPQARMLLEGTCREEFARLWDAWIAERSAPAVPGALAFVRAARGMKDTEGRAVRVFFVTNRECRRRAGNPAPCPQEDDTLANLRALGLDAPGLADDLMMKGERPGWDSEKRSRRLEIAATHRVLLNVGDDLGDFLPDARRLTVAGREQARCAQRERWGNQWFMIPNPMYGSWLAVLGEDSAAALAARAPAAYCDED